MLIFHVGKQKVRKVYVQLITLIQSKSQSKIWAGERGNSYSLGYLDEIDSKRNRFLWELLLTYPARVIVEIGSNLGSKIIGLARENPQIRVLGLDINTQAVQMGKVISTELGLDNISFHRFDIVEDDFSNLGIDFSSSVIFSWATLIYVHPKDILGLLRNILELNCVGFVFIEQHSNRLGKLWKRGKLISGGPNFVRDYVYLLEKIGARKYFEINVKSVPSEVWSPGGGHANVIFGRRK